MVTRVSRTELDALQRSGSFDAAWYLAEYPDVGLTGLDPAEHFLWIGKRLGRRTAPSASRAQALPQPSLNDRRAPTAPEPGSATDGPGRAERGPSAGAARPPESIPATPRVVATTPDRPAVVPPQRSEPVATRRDPTIDPHLYETVAAEMSVEFYLLSYPDVAAAGVDPIGHYIMTGWIEGRNPDIAFSTRFYLDSNPDVVQAKVNPYYHWLVAGRAEGREGKHALGFRYDILASLKPVMDQISETKAWRNPVRLSPLTELTNRIAALSSANARLVLSFSHDDFQNHVGGVQLLLRRELALLRAHGWTQFHVYPAHPLLFLDTSGESVVLGVVIDGEPVGFYRAEDIIAAAAAVGEEWRAPRFVVHNLLGHNMDQAIAILRAFDVREGYFWLHDYAALYNNYKLLRNDVEYRGMPRKGTVAYQLCEFARAPFCQADEFAKLFGMFRVHVIAPSQATLDIWNAAGIHIGASVNLLDHCQLNPLPAGRTRRSGGPMKVGFLGYPAMHKGWPVFFDLILRFGDDPRYSFHHLGQGQQGGLPVTYKEVLADADNPDAMKKAVLALEIDVAIVWSIWPETFCLTAYEALAGGAALIGNPDGGNIPRLIETMDCGLVLPNESALIKAFASGEVLSLARDHRPAAGYELVYSALTSTYLGEA